jgi:hypothetical protein
MIYKKKQRPFVVVFFFDYTKEKTFTQDKSVNKEQKVDSKYKLTQTDYSLSFYRPTTLTYLSNATISSTDEVEKKCNYSEVFFFY